MQTHLVVTFIADDRPGLVEHLSQVVSAHEGNWLESRMSYLAGKFAGIVRLGVPVARAAAARDALRALEAGGFTVLIEEAGAPSVAAGRCAFMLDIVGHDRPASCTNSPPRWRIAASTCSTCAATSRARR